MAFSSLSEYERVIYSLQETRSGVVLSTLRLYSTSSLLLMIVCNCHSRYGLHSAHKLSSSPNVPLPVHTR